MATVTVFRIAWMNMVSQIPFLPSQIQRKRKNWTVENTANSNSGTYTNKNTVVVKFDGQTLNWHCLQKKKCCLANSRNTTEWIKWISESFSEQIDSLNELLTIWKRDILILLDLIVLLLCITTHWKNCLLLERITYFEKRWPTDMLLRK